MNMNKSNDNINHPKHYQGDTYECIDVLKDVLKDLKGFEAFCIGNVFKYIWRYKRKNGLEDLNKANWYLNCVINHYDTINTLNIEENKSFNSEVKELKDMSFLKHINITGIEEITHIHPYIPAIIRYVKEFGGKKKCLDFISQIIVENPFDGTPQKKYEICYIVNLIKSFITTEDEVFLNELQNILDDCDCDIQFYILRVVENLKEK